MIGDKVFLEKLPATELLQLEHQLDDLFEFAKTIPTLDPALGFEPDTNRQDGVFKARDVVKPRTKKVETNVVVIQPTVEHPGQWTKMTEDVVIGTTLQQEWSSLITIKRKGEILDRIEDLLRAVKSARARANEQEVDVAKNKIGQKILDFVFQGK